MSQLFPYDRIVFCDTPSLHVSIGHALVTPKNCWANNPQWRRSVMPPLMRMELHTIICAHLIYHVHTPHMHLVLHLLRHGWNGFPYAIHPFHRLCPLTYRIGGSRKNIYRLGIKSASTCHLSLSMHPPYQSSWRILTSLISMQRFWQWYLILPNCAHGLNSIWCTYYQHRPHSMTKISCSESSPTKRYLKFTNMCFLGDNFYCCQFHCCQLCHPDSSWFFSFFPWNFCQEILDMFLACTKNFMAKKNIFESLGGWQSWQQWVFF